MERATNGHGQRSFRHWSQLLGHKTSSLTQSPLDHRYPATNVTWQSVYLAHDLFACTILPKSHEDRQEKRWPILRLFFLLHSSYIEAFCIHTFKPVPFQHPTLTIHKRKVFPPPPDVFAIKQVSATWQITAEHSVGIKPASLFSQDEGGVPVTLLSELASFEHWKYKTYWWEPLNSIVLFKILK